MALIAYSGYGGLNSAFDFYDVDLGGVSLQTSDGPFNDPYVRMQTTNPGATKTTDYTGASFSSATIFVNTYFRVGRDSASVNLVNANLVRLNEEDAGSGFHSGVYITSAGMLAGISGRLGSPTLGISTSHEPIVAGKWYHLEVKQFIHDSTGTIECRLDGNPTSVLNLSGLDNRDGGSLGICDEINMVGDNGSINQPHEFASTLMFDDSGGAPFNDWLGEVRATYQPVDGNGFTNQWTGSDADSTDNYLHVDDNPPHDSETSYNEDDTTGNIDLYALNLDVSGKTIRTLMIRNYAKFTGSGLVHPVKMKIRAGGTNYDGDTRNPSSAYTILNSRHDTNPDTAVAWVDTDTAEFGQEVV